MVFKIMEMKEIGIKNQIIDSFFGLCKGYSYKIGYDKWLKACEEWEELRAAKEVSNF